MGGGGYDATLPKNALDRYVETLLAHKVETLWL